MPELRVDIDAIGRNAEAVASLLRRHGLDLVAVTKGCLGEPRVAAAMLAGGAIALADTRDENLRRLRAALPAAELHRIHLPSIAGPFEPGDVTYVTSCEGAAAVAAATAAGTAHRVMVQVETGDEREGVPGDRLLELAAYVVDEPRLLLEGVSTNYACFLGSPAGIEASVAGVAAAAQSLRSAGIPVDRVSGGNSSVLWLLERGAHLPEEVTELRCGEALLLGQDALHYQPLSGCTGAACMLRVEVLEEYTKPAPGGRARRLVLGIGRQELGGGTLKFHTLGLTEVGRSADYLVVEAEQGVSVPAAGSTVEMVPAYEALAAAWTSPYVTVTLVAR